MDTLTLMPKSPAEIREYQREWARKRRARNVESTGAPWIGSRGRGGPVDITGQRFGSLVAVSCTDSDGSGKGARWLCQCDCGNTSTPLGLSLRIGNTRSCGCGRRQKGNRLPHGRSARNSIVHVYKGAAKRRGLCWLMPDDEVDRIFASDCHYCGARPTRVRRLGRSSSFVYNGLDRVDSRVGYTPANVVACCFNCNYAKRDMTLEQFTEWIDRLVRVRSRRRRKGAWVGVDPIGDAG